MLGQPGTAAASARVRRNTSSWRSRFGAARVGAHRLSETPGAVRADLRFRGGRLSEKHGQDNAIISPGQLELGTEEPTGEVHRILSGADRGRDPRQRHGPINQHHNPIAAPGRERVRRLERRRRVQRRLPADAPQPTAVMRTHRTLHRVTEHRINPAERIAQTRQAACTRQACTSRRSIRQGVNSELSTRTGRLAVAHLADRAFRVRGR